MILLTNEQARERIEGILKAAGIKVQATMVDLIAYFPDGAAAYVDAIEVFADGLNEGR